MIARTRAQLMRIAALLFWLDALLSLAVMVGLMAVANALGWIDWADRQGWAVLIGLGWGLGYLAGLITPPISLFVQVTYEEEYDDGEA